MPKKSKLPASVRVARWVALTASITGLFTMGDTFLKEKPWFLTDTPTPIVETSRIQSVGLESEIKNKSYESAPMIMPTSSPTPNWYDRSLSFIKKNAVAFWIIFISTVVFGGYTVVEFFYSKKKKQDKLDAISNRIENVISFDKKQNT